MRTISRVVLLLGVAVLIASPAGAQGGTPLVLELPVEGVVDPFVTSHVEREIRAAAARDADAVLLRVDTPGGLDSSMRTIVKAVLNSPVPVVCYVAPQGARAASAGAFILIACPVAAMAPGTNVGAAAPVGVSGATASRKALEDGVAYIRGLAEQRGRNADWAESAVRESASLPAEEALDRNVIDVVAPGTAALLNEVDGRTVEVGEGRTVTLRTAGALVEARRLGLLQGFLHALLDPNFAFVFFWLGLALVVIEFLVPGIGAAGITGGLLLLAAFVAFGMLPVQLAGVILLVASAVLFLLELHAPGVGALTIGGLLTLVLGGLLLFDTAVPGAGVSPLVIAPVALLVLAFFAWIVGGVLKLHRHPVVASGMERLVGREGRAIEDLDPEGFVWIGGEEWKASSSVGHVDRGAGIRVVAIDGVRLRVEPVDDPRTRRVETTDAPSGAQEGGRS